MGSEVKEVGIVATGTDKGAAALLKKTSTGMDKVGRVSEKAATKIEKVGRAAKGATGNALQMRNAMFEVGNTLATGGNQAGIMANQFIEAGARMVGTGSLGLAIGAITVAVAAGKIAWGLYSDSLDGMDEATSEAIQNLESMKTSTENLNKELALVGKTGGEKRLAEARILAEEQFRFVSALQDLNEEDVGDVISMGEVISGFEDARLAQARLLREQGAITEELIFAEKEKLGELSRQLEITKRIVSEQGELDRRAERRKDSVKIESDLMAKREREQVDANRRIDKMINDSAKERQRQSKEAGRLAKKQARDDIREARKVDIEKRRLANAEKRRRQEIANDAIMVTRIAGSIIAADGEEARKAAISNALDIATVKISARAAEGAAGAFTSAVEELGWFFGPIVGAAAGTAVFASIMALRTQVIGMATGGAVQGKDSINAKLMPGEVVLPAGFIRDLSRIASSRGAASPQPSTFANGDTGGRSAGGGLSVTNNFSTLVLDSISAKREARRSNRELSKLRSRGML